jgi:hypothetical protein
MIHRVRAGGASENWHLNLAGTNRYLPLNRHEPLFNRPVSLLKRTNGNETLVIGPE